jgi:hypothetical protein
MIKSYGIIFVSIILFSIPSMSWADDSGLLSTAKPPVLQFDADAGEEYQDSEDDELETGDYKYLTSVVKVSQAVSYRCDYAVGVKHLQRQYDQKNQDNSANALTLDINYRLAKPWLWSVGAEEEAKDYKDVNYDYGKHNIWTAINFKSIPWEMYVKTGFSRIDYSNLADKADISYEVGANRYLFSKDSNIEVKYKYSIRDYEGKGNKTRRNIHLGVKHGF